MLAVKTGVKLTDINCVGWEVELCALAQIKIRKLNNLVWNCHAICAYGVAVDFRDMWLRQYNIKHQHNKVQSKTYCTAALHELGLIE